MGFKCDVTGQHIQSKPKKIVNQIRTTKYDCPAIFDEMGKIVRGPIVSEGWETVREINVDPMLDQAKIDRLTAKLPVKKERPRRERKEYRMMDNDEYDDNDDW